MFPRANKKHSMNKRGKEVFHVKSAKTERMKAIVSMQKLLNKDVSETSP